ncbi:CynX/NimT family MFS transporter [Paenibacillus protaetiae]|uniref:MFS transporter n=1 Tax=Paenibacillus protaetiae TaxID=2509456 RepID=A0A4P6ETB8_9BACL|nr:MFS transporter [Paenibacillus protaetiae]QAY65866.1 MFS transporter [Paenibacillus protaetiae]
MHPLQREAAGPDTQKQAGALFLMLSIMLIASNMRAPLTSVGPLISDIKADTGMSSSLAGLITTVPLLAFALLSPFAPRIAQKYGTERTILYAMIALVIGTVCRFAPGTPALFGGTVIIGLAIALFNVLLPSLVKRDFARQAGLATGLYSVSMNLCGALASGISVPLAQNAGLGWRGAIGCWLILAAAAFLLWLPRMSRPALSVSVSQRNTGGLWRSPLAWQVTAFMGLQSLIFYILVAWLPEILASRGLSADTAGWMLSLLQFSMLPFTFIVPIIAGKMHNQRVLVIVTAALYVFSLLGFMFSSTTLIPVWSVLIGIAGAFSFSLAMIFFNLRTKTAQEAAQLSGMAQSVGYLLAALGPLLFGLLHDAAHNWSAPLLILIAASLLIFIFGMGAARNRYVR